MFKSCSGQFYLKLQRNIWNDVVEAHGEAVRQAFAAAIALARRDAAHAAIATFATFRQVANQVSCSIASLEYLAKTLSQADKRHICNFHYEYVGQRCVSDDFLTLIYTSFPVWCENVDGIEYRIDLYKNMFYRSEGELNLLLRVSGEWLFVISFTIAPGQFFGLDDRAILLVSRMQGRPNAHAEIRKSGNDLHGVSPQAILFAALRGVSKFFRVEKILGTTAANHISESARGEDMVRSYDTFFVAIRATLLPSGFYVTEAEPVFKSEQDSSTSHRSRRARRRRFKAEVMAQVWEACEQRLTAPLEMLVGSFEPIRSELAPT